MISVDTRYPLHVKHAHLFLPHRPEEIFPFFSEARNLQRITPPWLDFRIETEGQIEMGVGAEIDYRLKVHGIPLRWRTRIVAWEPPYYFADQQLKGPYQLWLHEHRFQPLDNGTLCSDRVRYAVPGGPLAPLVHRFFVKRDVDAIFAYRMQRLQEIFDAEHVAAHTQPTAALRRIGRRAVTLPND